MCSFFLALCYTILGPSLLTLVVFLAPLSITSRLLGWIMAPQRYPVPNPWKCECYFVWQKGFWRYTLRILWWGDYPDYPGAINVITNVLLRGRQRRIWYRRAEIEMTVRAEIRMMLWQAKEWLLVATRSWKEQGSRFFPETLEGCMTLLIPWFSTLRFGLGFWLPEL